MKKIIKYGVVPVVIFLFLLIATVIVLPVVINVQKFIPEIEEKLSEVTGRPLSIGSNLGISFFPWLSLSFSDLKIGNPEGYQSNGFIEIESFEARVRLLPLFKKEVEISRFIIGGLEVHLEKRSDGRVNWDFSGDDSTDEPGGTPSSGVTEWSFPEGLSIGLFAVTDGTVIWSDETPDSPQRIDDLMLVLNNVTFNNPLAMELKASIGGKSLTAEGTLGPLGKKPGQGDVPIDLAVSLNDKYSGRVQGKFIDLLDNLGYDLDVHVSDFQARELFTSLDMDFPVVSADPTTFRSVGLDITAKGDNEQLSIEKGTIKIDDTLIDIFLALKNVDHPDLTFALDIDRLDLDRYLPPKGNNNNGQVTPPPSGRETKDYTTWRKINLDGAIQVRELKVGGGTVNDLKLSLHGADGIFAVAPSSFFLYQGRAESTLTVDFQSDTPQTSIDFKAEGVQVLPLLHDFLDQDFMSGTVDTDIRLLFTGNSAEAIKTSLYADGTLTVKDGALEGIDMVNPIRNIAALPSHSDSAIKNIRTDISEMKSMFTIRNGLVSSSESTLDSPLAGVVISGTADLISEQLELEVTPRVALALPEEQGTGQELSGDSVPFALSGTFAKPKVDIDAKYLSLDELNLSDESDMQILVDEKLPSPAEEDVKNLVGTTLIDPVVVAERFGLEPDLIPQEQAKKQLTLGTGKVKINPLQEEDDWH